MTVPLAETIHTAMDGFIHYLAYGIIRHYASVRIDALPLQRQEVWHAVDSLQDFHGQVEGTAPPSRQFRAYAGATADIRVDDDDNSTATSRQDLDDITS